MSDGLATAAITVEKHCPPRPALALRPERNAGAAKGLTADLEPSGGDPVVATAILDRFDILDEHGRPEPPLEGDETETLLGFLEFQRATLAWKCSGLGADGLRATTAASEVDR